MYRYLTLLVAVVFTQTVISQETTSADLSSSVTTFIESVIASTVQPFTTASTESQADFTATAVTPSLTFTNGDSTTVSFSTATGDFTVATVSSILSTTGPADTTIEAITLIGTDDASDSGSGTTDEATATSSTNAIENGSGLETTILQEGSGFTTTDAISDQSGSGSGSTEVTTIASSETTFTATSFEGSGNLISTESINATTVFEVSTGFNTTTFNITTAAPPVESPADFPWYLIVIICLAVIILILIIIIVVVYCKKKEQSGPALLKKATLTNADAETVPKTSQAAHGFNQPRAVPVPAPTIFPSETIEEPKMNFVSTSPMKAPLYVFDPSSSVRKRDKARSRPKEPSFDDDEGFNEPLMARDEKPPRRKGKRRKAPIQSVQDVTTESEADPSERTRTYQPYFLPTPIQTALTGKALGNQLTDDALAERHHLQRSDIERHQNKQRLRMQSHRQPSDSFKNQQRTIDAVLQPLPPKALQGIEERRRLQKHGLIDDDVKPQKRRKPSRHDSVRSGTSDDTTTSEGKQAAHEKVIAKMTKLLEDAYALLAPAIQKTSVKPFNSGPDSLQTPYHQQPSTSNLQQPHDERLFTRTNTPPVLLPQPGLHGHTNPAYSPGTILPRSNDSHSPVWTPYRTFDRFQELQKQDTSLSTVPNTRPPNAIQNILVPNAPYQSTAPNFYPLHQGIHDPFAPTVQNSIPGRAQPVSQYPNSFQMNPMGTTPMPQSTSSPLSNNPTTDQTKNFIDAGVDEPTASIVQSIKDTLAELTENRAPGNTTQESNC